MKFHLTLSTASQYAHNQSDKTEAIATRTHAGSIQTSPSEAVHAQPHLTLVSAPIWRHKLILTGKLDHRSAPELEEEIECLCQEGVTTLTLDLRQLEEIDSAGGKVIALHGAACKRRGQDFAVIAGSHVIHHALTEAGAADLLRSEPNKSIATNRSEGSLSDRTTTMIKNL
jgi:anti-anti-sigma factor